MKTIQKYLIEKKIQNRVSDIKSILENPKSGRYDVGDTEIQMDVSGKIVLVTIPSKEEDTIFNFVQAADQLKRPITHLKGKSSKEVILSIVQ